MKTKRHILTALGLAAMLVGCATVSRNPQQDIVGVWELTKALMLRPCDAGFVGNIKLVFLPDGKLYRMDPGQTNLAASAEFNFFGYKLNNGNIIRISPDGDSTRAPFSLRGKTLIITESNGEHIYYRKHSSDPTQIPVLEARYVPFSVNYDWKPPPVDYEKNMREAFASLQFISLTTIQGMKSGSVSGFEDDDGNVLVLLDNEDPMKPYGDYYRVEYEGVSKEDALKILKAKEKELHERWKMRTKDSTVPSEGAPSDVQ